jgi:hypothetical protein
MVPQPFTARGNRSCPKVWAVTGEGGGGAGWRPPLDLGPLARGDGKAG